MTWEDVMEAAVRHVRAQFSETGDDKRKVAAAALTVEYGGAKPEILIEALTHFAAKALRRGTPSDVQSPDYHPGSVQKP